MDILVTGASGFTGTALVAQLRTQGHTVHGYGRSPSPSVHHMHLGNITDVPELTRVLKSIRPTWVFHLATDTRHTWDPSEVQAQYHTNVCGTASVLAACAAQPPQALIALGTLEEYGDQPVPFQETQSPRPPNPYALTKAISSTWLPQTATRLGIAATVLRIPIAFGPGQHESSFIGSAFRAIQTGVPLAMSLGEQTRNFMYVGDAVTAMIAAASCISACRGQVLNAGPEWEVSLKDAITVIAEVTGATDFARIGAKPYKPREQMRYMADCSRMRAATGWQASTDFRTGIEKTWAAYSAERSAKPLL